MAWAWIAAGDYRRVYYQIAPRLTGTPNGKFGAADVNGKGNALGSHSYATRLEYSFAVAPYKERYVAALFWENWNPNAKVGGRVMSASIHRARQRHRHAR